MEIENLLREEIQREFEKLKDIEKGTAEYKAVVEGITKLTDRAIEYEKIEADKREKVRNRKLAKEQADLERRFKEQQAEFEREFKEKQAEESKAQAEFDKKLKLKQMEEDRTDRWIKNGIAIVGIILPIGLSVWGTFKSFEFEKEGTITTIMGRGYINKLIPKK